MDFLRGTNLASLVLLAVSTVLIAAGLRAMLLGRRTIYFRHRRQRVLAGWRMVGVGFLMVVVALVAYRPGRPFLLPASPAPTSVPTAAPPTVTPSRVPSPSPSPTRTVVVTASPTLAPQLPLSVEALAVSSVTPQADAEIFEIRFSTEMDHLLPVAPNTQWINPIRRMFATFKYRNMTPGAQWTALWFRDGSLVFIDTKPWQGGAAGRDYSFWEPVLPYDWLPGGYEVQFFVGTQWKASGYFTLTGAPVQPTPTLTPRPTRIPRITPSTTPTPHQ